MPKPKSELVESLDTVQSAVHSYLKPLGFRKKGRAHNHYTDGGLIHVIGFQMGEYPIGDHYVIPSLRESYYGQFAVNLGIFLPCVYEVEQQHPAADFVQEYQCTIRQRLGVLAFGEDRWFTITGDVATLASTVVDLLDRFGLDFLEQFKSYSDVLTYYRLHGDLPFQNSNRASLEAALVAHRSGDEALACSLFAKALCSNHRGFQEHVVELANRIGCRIG